MELMDYAFYKAMNKNGGGSNITVEPLSVTENGTYTAEEGTAYSPVTVNVPNSYTSADEGKAVQNGALAAQTAATKTGVGTYNTTYNNSVTFQLGELATPAAAADIASGKTAYGADGSVITGTASGGGSIVSQSYSFTGADALDKVKTEDILSAIAKVAVTPSIATSVTAENSGDGMTLNGTMSSVSSAGTQSVLKFLLDMETKMLFESVSSRLKDYMYLRLSITYLKPTNKWTITIKAEGYDGDSSVSTSDYADLTTLLRNAIFTLTWYEAS